MNIIAFDPGETTGVAELFESKVEVIEFPFSELLKTQQRTNFYNYDVILCEDYVIRPDTVGHNIGSKLVAVKVIGILEFVAHLHRKNLVMQPPSIKTAWPKNRLLAAAEKFGITKEKLNSPHKRDALRHLLYYLERGTPIVTEPEVIE